MKIFGNTHIGLIRNVNQDNFVILDSNEDYKLVIVCDGIAGGNAGEVAAEIAIDEFKKLYESIPTIKNDTQAEKWIKDGLNYINDAIYSKASTSKNYKGMGTTIVGTFITKKSTYVFNAGDSRLYGLYKKDFVCLTQDHTVFELMTKKLGVSEEEAINAPDAKKLTNALGVYDQVEIEFIKIKSKYEYLLLCSDGLHTYVNEEVIIDILKLDIGIEEKVNALINVSLEAGGYDNVTVVILQGEK